MMPIENYSSEQSSLLVPAIKNAIDKLRLLGSFDNIRIVATPIAMNMIKMELFPLSSTVSIPIEGYIFGVKISFDHFENKIVVYDWMKASFDDRFKVEIDLFKKVKFHFQKADESSFDGTAADRYSADKVAFVSPNDANPMLCAGLLQKFN